ncbi:MAG: hypothetical protein JWQ19_1476 [Subtercola sp.]|nr:hypothetical protein [Subtercola sp.]
MLYGYLLNGLAAGGGYALVGVGLSFTIGTARVFNFAYGTMYMIATLLVAFFAGSALGQGYLLACLIMIAIMAVLAFVFARIAVLPVINVSESAVMISTLAISLLLANLAQLVFGSQAQFIEGSFAKQVLHLGDALISTQAIIALVAAPIATLALVMFMRRTSTGLQIRATAQNPALAEATGVNTNTTFTIAVVIGIVLAALAGALYGPTSTVDAFSGDAILLKAFTVAALAGMGRLWGAVIVGVGMGVAESLFSGYASPAFASAFIYALLIVTLLFFPKGVFKGE